MGKHSKKNYTWKPRSLNQESTRYSVFQIYLVDLSCYDLVIFFKFFLILY